MGGMALAAPVVGTTEENHSPKHSFHLHDGINVIPINTPITTTTAITTIILTVPCPRVGIKVVLEVDRHFYDFEKLDWIDRGVVAAAIMMIRGVLTPEVNNPFLVLHHPPFQDLPLPRYIIAVDPIHLVIHSWTIIPTTTW